MKENFKLEVLKATFIVFIVGLLSIKTITFMVKQLESTKVNVHSVIESKMKGEF